MTNSFNFNEDWSDFVQSLEENYECSICLESFSLKSNKLIKSCCNHIYCKTCFDQINSCSICRTDLKKKIKKFSPTIQPTIQTIQLNNSNNSHTTYNVSRIDNTTLTLTLQDNEMQNQSQSSTSGINIYSFALRPEDHRPSGSCNVCYADPERQDLHNSIYGLGKYADNRK